MGKTIVVPVVLSLGIAAPAKPCSEAPITVDPVPLLTDGATVPTNPVVVGFARFASLAEGMCDDVGGARLLPRFVVVHRPRDARR